MCVYLKSKLLVLEDFVNVFISLDFTTWKIVTFEYKLNILWQYGVWCINVITFPLAPKGSSLPGLRTLDPPLRPPSTLAEIFWFIFSSFQEILSTFLFFRKKTHINRPHVGQRGPPNCCFTLNIIFFVT